jgi:signal transduction histidine kinase
MGRTPMDTESALQNQFDWQEICRRNWIVGIPYLQPNTDKYMTKIAVPVRARGKKCKSVTAALEFNPVHMFMESNRFLDSGYLVILDGNNQVITTNYKDIDPDRESSITQQFASVAGKTPQKEIIIKDSAQTEYIATWAPLQEIKGIIISLYPKSIILKRAGTMRQMILLEIVAAVAIAFVLAALAKKVILKPMKAVQTLVTNLQEGQYGQQIAVQGNDEFAELLNSFNLISTQLKTLNQTKQEQIQTEQTKTKAIIDSLADGIIVVNQEMEVILANPMALDILNEPFKPGDMLSGSTSAIATVMADIFSRAFVKEGEVFYGELNFGTDLPGRQQTIEVLANGVRRENGVLIGMVAVLRDITHEKEMDRMRSNISSLLSHEIKNPLASIIGMSEIIATDSDVDQVTVNNFCNSIFKHSKRIQDLVNDFLNLSRLEDGSMSIKRELLNLKQLIEETLMEHEFQLNQKNLTIKLHMPDDDLLVVGDKRLLKQAFINLISNSIKYNKENGRIDIIGGKTKKTYRLVFSDSGIGIKDDEIPKIFHRFYRIRNEETANIEGTGLGLPFVKEIIDRHGGQILVESKQMQGSRFIIDLPRRT